MDKPSFVEELLSQLEEQRQQVGEVERQEAVTRRKRDEELRALAERRERARMVIRHIEALLALHGQRQPQGQPESAAVWGDKGEAAKEEPGASLADLAYQLIRDTGKEWHYKELADALIQRGFPIPGSVAANSLVARIYNDPRLIRPRRGVYALKEWYPAGTPSVGTRKTSQTKKRSRRGTRRASATDAGQRAGGGR